ncbi:regulator of microtubule dynamics protein 1-like [Cardiocondyla obscurior]|uniref:regulator of microtubule dynamics protein 1-like n=1 Tax=Cardiocondyla obscurior TaxID=286306 RepID=UPI0039658187
MLLQKLYRFINSSRVLQSAVLQKNVYPICQKKNNVHPMRKLIISPFTIMGLWVVKNNQDNTEITTSELLVKADTLFDGGNYKDTYELLLQYKDNKEVEILWRISRAIYKMTEMISTDIDTRKLTFEGYDLLRTALDIQEDHYAVHKYMSLFLANKSALEGVKAQMKEAYNVKKHIQRALELKPDDPMLFHILGCWCYEVSNLPWYKRKIAAIIFGEPPTSSFEEALMYYENAEKASPNFYSCNLLKLGKIYLKLNRKEDAKKYLNKVAEFPAKDDEDRKAKQEAQKILSNI